MKKVLFFSALALLLAGGSIAFVPKSPEPASAVNCSSCTFKNFKMYGKVQVVNSFPDVKVQIVNSFPDLKVEKVTSFPDKCGKWQFVESFPDVKIQFVESFPDVKIQYVTSFPGCN
jgi:hypothetical protein